MGLGSTAKKIQRLSNIAEKLYEQVNEVLERLSDLTDRVETASEDVQAVRREQREQRAIIDAIAAEQGIDVATVVEEADPEIHEAEPDSQERSDEGANGEGRPDEGTDVDDRSDGAEASADAS